MFDTVSTYKCEGSFNWANPLPAIPVPATTVPVKESTGSRVTRAFPISLTNNEPSLATTIPYGRESAMPVFPLVPFE